MLAMRLGPPVQMKALSCRIHTGLETRARSFGDGSSDSLEKGCKVRQAKPQRTLGTSQPGAPPLAEMGVRVLEGAIRDRMVALDLHGGTVRYGVA